MLLFGKLASRRTSTRYGWSFKWPVFRFLFIIASKDREIIAFIPVWPFPYLSDRSTWTDILRKWIQFPVRYRGVIIFGANHVSRLLAGLGLGIHVMASLNLTIWWQKEDKNNVWVSLVVAFVWRMVQLTRFTCCKTPIEKEAGCNHMTVSPY